MSSQTAYFGGQTTGPDTITAVNGTNIWGTASLTIVGGAPAQVAITPSPTTPTVSSLTNTTLSLQLEDSGGNFTNSSGTTTLTLSAPSGFFATSPNSSGTPTLTVTFASGVGTATAYFGDETSGSVVVTAKNGASAWGTSALTLVAGTPTQVQITLNPANPGKSAVTNATVTLQLLDQFNNIVHASGVSLTLSNSGAGYFAPMGNETGPGTAMVTTNASGVATYYFGDNTTQSVTITATGTGISSTSGPISAKGHRRRHISADLTQWRASSAPTT